MSTENEQTTESTEKVIYVAWVNGGYGVDEIVDFNDYACARPGISAEEIAAEIASGKHGPLVKVLEPDYQLVRYVPLTQVILYVAEKSE